MRRPPSGGSLDDQSVVFPHEESMVPPVIRATTGLLRRLKARLRPVSVCAGAERTRAVRPAIPSRLGQR